MFEPARKSFPAVLAEHVSVDPGRGVLGNVGDNLGRARDKIRARALWHDRARQMDAAIEAFNRQRATKVADARLEDRLGQVIAVHDAEGWRRVPGMVVDRFKRAAWAACRLAAWADPAAGPEDRLWWHGDSKTAWAEVADLEKRGDWERLPDVPDIPGVALFVEPIPPPPVAGWVLVKAADGYLEPLARPGQAVQRAIGGPNGLTEALVNGLIGGGLGYGAGWIADQFLPEEHFQKGRLPLTFGLVGAGVPAALGLWQYSAEQRAKGLPPGDGTPDPLPLPTHRPIPQDPLNDRLPPPYTSPDPPRGFAPVRGWPAPPPPAPEAGWPKAASIHPRFHKAAETTGALFLRSIPVDAFGQVVWNDVRNPPNAFGTKSPWDDNSQPLGTPPYAAAAVTGLLSGTAQAAGSPVVSPWQVASAAAVGTGKGWLTGLAAGRVLGVLAGLRPEAQQKLQSAGLWGGLITGVANALYR
jgi:hypothetical protein